MPGGNRTGPMGVGPRTGRAAGYCSGSGQPGYANTAPGRGFGMGFGSGRSIGGGRGWRNRFYATGTPGRMCYSDNFGYPMAHRMPDPESEKQSLKTQADALKEEMDLITKRLEELEAKRANE